MDITSANMQAIQLVFAVYVLYIEKENKKHSIELELTVHNNKIFFVDTVDAILKMRHMMADEALLLSQNNTINNCNKYGNHNNKLIIGFDLEWRDPQLGMY
jgi:hypothetical protein